MLHPLVMAVSQVCFVPTAKYANELFLINPLPISSLNWNFLLDRKCSQIFLTAMKVTSNVCKIIMITSMCEKNMENMY